MNTVEVLTRREKREFHEFPRRLYKNDPGWTCPLDSMIESVFEPRRYHAFKNGEATRWILRDDDNNTIGREE